MNPRSPDDSISRSLAPLREVVTSLSQAAAGDLPPPAERRRLLRRLRAAGGAALPALLRALVSPVETEGRWAAWLLLRLGDPRVVERVTQAMEDPRACDEAKARAAELLADLTLGPRRSSEQLGEAFTDGEPPGAISPADLLAAHGTDPAIARAVEQFARGEEPGREIGEAGAQPPPGRAGVVARRRSRDASYRRRALDLVEVGEHKLAVPLLRRAVARDPADGEALSYLGLALLHDGDPAGALPPLEAAAELHPDEALGQWNIAAAAKAAGQMCKSYLALVRYLELEDDFTGARARRREAKRFVGAYEALFREMYPDVPLPELIEGERLFERAYAAMEQGRYADAVRGFREVIARVPTHHPSWGNLGAAELALGDREEAARCLRRALELKPDYDVARDNLDLLETRH